MRPRGYSWFTHTRRGAQCKLQPCPCTNIHPGTFTHRLHLIDTWPSISAAARAGSSLRSIWSVQTVAWCTVPPPLPPSELPSPGECLCLLLVRAYVSTLLIYKRHINDFVSCAGPRQHPTQQWSGACEREIFLDILGNMLFHFLSKKIDNTLIFDYEGEQWLTWWNPPTDTQVSLIIIFHLFCLIFTKNWSVWLILFSERIVIL